MGLKLIRLQCYVGIDATQALYDWDFPRQLLHLRTLEAASVGPLDADAADALDGDLYIVVKLHHAVHGVGPAGDVAVALAATRAPRASATCRAARPTAPLPPGLFNAQNLPYWVDR